MADNLHDLALIIKSRTFLAASGVCLKWSCRAQDRCAYRGSKIRPGDPLMDDRGILYVVGRGPRFDVLEFDRR